MPCFSTRAMKSGGVKRARADLAKCGSEERKLSGAQWMLVKLHRPPPEMRIFLPRRSARSSTATRRPRFPASMPQKRPAAPAPRTMASNLRGDDKGSSDKRRVSHRVRGERQEKACRREEEAAAAGVIRACGRQATVKTS